VSIVEVRPPGQRPSPPVLPAGTRVAVRNHYLGTWSAGFEVLSHDADGYRIGRLSDGAVIDQVIAFDDVREPYDRREPYVLDAPVTATPSTRPTVARTAHRSGRSA